MQTLDEKISEATRTINQLRVELDKRPATSSDQRMAVRSIAVASQQCFGLIYDFVEMDVVGQ